jgi:hypothetical protein
MQIKAPISPKGQYLIAWARIRNVTLTHLSAAEAGVVSLATVRIPGIAARDSD